MKFTTTAITSLLSLSALATAFPAIYSESDIGTLHVRSLDDYTETLGQVHSIYRRELEVRDQLIREILERAITGWHDPKTLSGGKSGPKKAANAAKKTELEKQASDWAEKNKYSHVTIQ